MLPSREPIPRKAGKRCGLSCKDNVETKAGRRVLCNKRRSEKKKSPCLLRFRLMSRPLPLSQYLDFLGILSLWVGWKAAFTCYSKVLLCPADKRSMLDFLKILRFVARWNKNKQNPCTLQYFLCVLQVARKPPAGAARTTQEEPKTESDMSRPAAKKGKSHLGSWNERDFSMIHGGVSG